MFLSLTTSDFGSAQKQTALLDESKCHRTFWRGELGSGQQGTREKKKRNAKGDATLWFKAGETEKKILPKNGNWGGNKEKT